MSGSVAHNTFQLFVDSIVNLPLWVWGIIGLLLVVGVIVAFINGIKKVAIILLALLVLNFIAGGKSAVLLKYTSVTGNKVSNTISNQLNR